MREEGRAPERSDDDDLGNENDHHSNESDDDQKDGCSFVEKAGVRNGDDHNEYFMTMPMIMMMIWMTMTMMMMKVEGSNDEKRGSGKSPGGGEASLR